MTKFHTSLFAIESALTNLSHDTNSTASQSLYPTELCHTVEAWKMWGKVTNLPQVGRVMHLDTIYRLEKGGSSDGRQLVYSNS